MAEAPSLARLARYFLRLGAFGFGGPIALTGYMHRDLVETRGWISAEEFKHGLALAQLAPGPLAAFIGYLVAGPLGASAAALGVFLPCFLFVVIPGPFYRRFADNPRIKAFVDGVTAAAAGAIAGAAIVLARRAIVDVPAALLAIATFAAVTKLKRLPEPLVIVAAGAIGFALWSWQ